MTPEIQAMQEAAVKTDLSPEQYAEAYSRLNDLTTMEMLHAAIGLCTEVGELQDAIKKYLFYGKPIDRINIMEEGGDISWYLRLLASSLQDLANGNCAFEEMILKNIAKLKQRYGEKFSSDAALNRNLEAEREILEKIKD